MESIFLERNLGVIIGQRCLLNTMVQIMSYHFLCLITILKFFLSNLGWRARMFLHCDAFENHHIIVMNDECSIMHHVLLEELIK